MGFGFEWTMGWMGIFTAYRPLHTLCKLCANCVQSVCVCVRVWEVSMNTLVE